MVKFTNAKGEFIMSISGKILKDLREKFGYSLEEVAKKVSSTSATISRYETGQRKINGENLVKLAKLFNVSPEYLLNGEKTSNGNAIIMTKDDLRKEMMAFFRSSDISEEDKQEIFNQMQEFYFSEKFEKKK